MNKLATLLASVLSWISIGVGIHPRVNQIQACKVVFIVLQKKKISQNQWTAKAWKMNPHLEERHGFEHCSSVDIRVRRLDLWVSMRLGKISDFVDSGCLFSSFKSQNRGD